MVEVEHRSTIHIDEEPYTVLHRKLVYHLHLWSGIYSTLLDFQGIRYHPDLPLALPTLCHMSWCPSFLPGQQQHKYLVYWVH